MKWKMGGDQKQSPPSSILTQWITGGWKWQKYKEICREMLFISENEE